MKKLTIIFAALTICFGFTAASFAQKISRADTPVTSTISNFATDGMPLNIQSDYAGAYKTDSSVSVTSIIQGIGDWELDMLGSTTRKVYVDFSNPVPNTNPNNVAPPTNGNYPARFLAQCSARGFNFLTLAAGTTVNCPLIGGIDFNGVRYQLRFKKEFSGANDIPVICNSSLNGKCNSWRAQTAGLNGNGKAVAQLVKITRVGSKSTEVFAGQYYFSFDISMTNP